MVVKLSCASTLIFDIAENRIATDGEWFDLELITIRI